MNKMLLVAVIIILAMTLSAEPVEYEQALSVAYNWLNHQNTQRGVIKELTLTEDYIRTIDEQTIFYVFNFAADGFVIVAGDDASFPILGYSVEGTGSLDDIPSNANSFFTLYEQSIQEIQAKGLSNETTRPEWEAILRNDFPPVRDFRQVGPLLSTQWNQNFPWNQHCPPDPSGPGGFTYAGCVAVAMGQVLRYWEYPEQGTGSHSYYHSNYGLISADFESATYNWADMPNNTATPSTSLLLFHLGVSVEMNYSPSGSGAYSADVPDALIQHFGYYPGAQYIMKGDYSHSHWIDILKNQLDNDRPLYYRGHGSGGHAFNCDGYDSNDLFHFNWGWGGSFDGFYNLNNLNPGNSDFSNSQATIVDLFPASPEPASAAPLAGDGTVGNPYQISNLNNLYWIAKNPARWDYHYVQVADIDASETEDWFYGCGFVPIGNLSENFTGSYNGDGHTVSGIYINSFAADYVGMFGYTNGANIENLGVIDVDIIAHNNVGALVGYSYDTDIANCYSSGAVRGNGWVGGLAGVHRNYGIISDSYSSVDVTSNATAGGLVALLQTNAAILGSYSTGTVTSENFSIGGFVGVSAYTSIISNCYSTSNVVSIPNNFSNVGGFLGRNVEGSSVTYSYSTGAVSGSTAGSSTVGGFVGVNNNSTIGFSYWNIETSGHDSSAGGYGRTTAEMTYPYGADTYVNWDFENVWVEDASANSYPYLQWQDFSLNPDIAVNPSPENGSTGVLITLEEVSWSYFAHPAYANALGFRVYINTTGEFGADDDFDWIPFTENQIEYSSSDILPEFQYETTYYWKVVPTTIDPLTAGPYLPGRNNRPEINRGDAQNCPVWSFTTQEQPSTHPNIAHDPIPADGATGIPYNTLLSWNYDSHPQFADPAGFRIRAGTDPELTTYEELFVSGGPGSYSIEPFFYVANNRTYYWQVIPTTEEPARRDQQRQRGVRRTSGRQRYDAEDCPVWSFTTEATPPAHAHTPSPEDQAVSVNIDTQLGWSYETEIGHSDPAGFRVNIWEGSMDEEPFFFHVPGGTGDFLSPGDAYSFSYNTAYYWQVLPFIIHQNQLIIAVDCPVWFFVTEEQSSVEDDGYTPFVTELTGNYPNPFNPETTIAFSLEKTEHVTIDIYNTKGQKVITLVDDNYPKGDHKVVWNSRDEKNSGLSSGIYFYRFTAGDYSAIKKMILLK